MLTSIPLEPGEAVRSGDRLYEITRVVDFDAVLARDQETGEIHKLLVTELEAPDLPPGEKQKRPDLASIPEEDWTVARERFEAIKPLLGMGRRTIEAVEGRAKIADVNRATIYRWIDTYERSGLLSSLLPGSRKGARAKKLDDEVEKIVQAAIEEKFLTKRKPLITDVHEKIKDQCKKGGLKPPHYNTLRNRIQAIEPKQRLASRVGKRIAAETYDPIKGKYPDAKWPYAVVQIDHTQLPINIVDDEDRQPIGKPYLTLAIEVFSRTVAGFSLSLEPPSATSVGLCLSHAILPKEDWLAKHGITTSWPMWGFMDVVHADNAKEFRGKMLKRVCGEYNIDLYWRPVKTPKYGGHIERLLGTFQKDLRGLPGSVGKDKEGREDYRPEKDATMTLKELERWLAVYITEKYHQQFHSGIRMSPIKKLEQGIFGDDRNPGRGLPPRLIDEERLRIDFMPSFTRTIQNYGIVRNHIHYYSHVLNRWINSKDPDNPKAKRSFRFNYFPMDMSTIYFYDPEIEDYFEVPFRDSSRPAVSEWELAAAERWLRNQGIQEIDEDLIFDANARMRQIEEDAVTKTKHIRRNAQRRKNAQEADKPKKKPGVVSIAKVPVMPDDIVPFDEMEELE